MNDVVVICGLCNQDIKKVHGCAENRVYVKSAGRAPGTLAPVRFGEERHYRIMGTAPRNRCDTCGVERGRVHHEGCCVEECPFCGGQALTCASLPSTEK